MARMLKPKGVIIFTDLLQSEKADPKKMQDIYARLSLPDLASLRLYEDSLYRAGLQKIMTKEETQTIKRHYGFVLNQTLTNYNELLERGCTEEWLKKQVAGLFKWIEAAEQALVLFGWVVYQKSQ